MRRACGGSARVKVVVCGGGAHVEVVRVERTRGCVGGRAQVRGACGGGAVWRCWVVEVVHVSRW
eukprot:352288-Chlamydomonas_euryale.AAC.6